MKRVELLAPAGSFEAFEAALNAGADAVYAGGTRFGARAFAQNFTDEQLRLAIKLSHLHGKKLYMTVNTLFKESELEELTEFMKPFYYEGLDGVIVQDMGAFLLLRDSFRDLELHASTQMTLTGPDGAAFLKELGASRIVPARELSISEIKSVKKKVDIEIEAFIHGAMCYCYSGQCLFSSMLGGRSGNRGRCAQPCRQSYRIYDNKNHFLNHEEEYPLSLKDMCTIGILPELIEAGIDSFKIEGRMKKPEYVAGTVALYRKYIDRYYDNPEAEYSVSKEDFNILKQLYIRSEISEGYYHKHNGRDMITTDKPGYAGADEACLNMLRTKYIRGISPVNIKGAGYFKAGEAALLTVSTGACEVSVYGDEVQTAIKAPLKEEDICKRLRKTGDTAFSFDELKVICEGEVFLPVAALNSLRRTAVSALEDKLLEPFREKRLKASVHNSCLADIKSYFIQQNGHDTERNTTPFYRAALVQTKDQLEEVIGTRYFDRIYIDADLAMDLHETFFFDYRESSVYIVLPQVIRECDKMWFDRILKKLHLIPFEGFYIKSLEKYRQLRSEFSDKRFIGGSELYAWNSLSKCFWLSEGITPSAPYELSRHDMQSMGCEGMELEVYGRTPLMVSAGCLKKTAGCCDSIPGITYLEDRYKVRFPVVNNCVHCVNTIYNSVPTSLHGHMSDIIRLKPAGLRFNFTVEDRAQTADVIRSFGQNEAAYSYTAGHFKKSAD